MESERYWLTLSKISVRYIGSRTLFNWKSSWFIPTVDINWCSLTLFRMGLSWMLTDGGRGQKGLLLKISQTYPRMMKVGALLPYLKIKKVNESHDTRLEFYWHQHFFQWESAKFTLSRNADMDRILIHKFWLF